MKYGRKLAACLAVSTALHGGVLFHDKIYDHTVRPLGSAATVLIDNFDRYLITRSMAELVTDARTRIKEGRFIMGEFILKANALDAMERGETPDIEKAGAKYAAYLKDLKTLLASGKTPLEAIPEVVNGLDYYGIPGGTVTEVLLEGGGSCEPFALLISSLLNDAGYGKNAYMRAYPPNEYGVGHIAALFVDNRQEYDFQAGKPSDKRGKRFHVSAATVVDAYVKHHSLDPSNWRWGGLALGIPDGRPTGFTFPDSPDGQAYSHGVPPMFSATTIKPYNPKKQTSSSHGGTKPRAGKDYTSKFLTAGNLARPAGSYGADHIITIAAQPSEQLLEQLSTLVEQKTIALGELSREQPAQTGEGWKLAKAYGALAGAYAEAEWQFSLAGKYGLARVARTQVERITQEARSLIGSLDVTVRDSGSEDPWELAYLGRNGNNALFGLIEERMDDGAGVPARSLAYLLAKEATRKEALESIVKLSMAGQAAIFSELDGAAIEGPGEFFRAYAAYNAITSGFGIEGKGIAVSGKVRIHELVPVPGGASIGLEGVQVRNGNISAFIATYDTNGRPVNGVPMQEGVTQRVVSAAFGTVGSLALRCTALDATTQTVVIDVIAVGNDFRALRELVGKKCAARGLGEDWKAALTTVCAEWAIEHSPTKPGFLDDFTRWKGTEPAMIASTAVPKWGMPGSK